MNNSDRAHREILSFKNYPKGWCYGEGIPFREENIENALKLNRLLLSNGMPKTNAFPGADGSIMVTAYADKYCWEFIFEHDKTVTIVTEEDGNVVEEKENLSFSDTILIAKKIVRSPKVTRKELPKVWIQYESSTRNTMTQIGNGIQPSHLGLQNANAIQMPLLEYPLLIVSASGPKEIRYARTSESTTSLARKSTPSFFGSSTAKPSQLVA